VFIDETSAYVGQSREYGWASSNERVHDSRPKGEKERVSLIAAVTINGHMAEQALVVTDTVNKNASLAFLDTLLPTLAKGSVLIMDNWTVHRLGQNGRYRACPHGDDVGDLVEACGCELLYLPTYSPDLNPIEHLFAKIKAFIKRIRPNTTDKLINAFCDAVKTVTPENVLNAFEHCGYSVEQ